jgi:hypothetical protein
LLTKGGSCEVGQLQVDWEAPEEDSVAPRTLPGCPLEITAPPCAASPRGALRHEEARATGEEVEARHDARAGANGVVGMLW